MSINKLVRANIINLQPYSSARHEFVGDAKIMLDANENAFGSPLTNNYNRYPDPYQKILKNKIAILKNIHASNIFLGNGSDEIIDLAIRIFCEPKIDEIIISSPTYGMYEVSASINNILINDIALDENNFDYLDEEVLKVVSSKTKIIFICSPNNPTGNIVPFEKIKNILTHFKGLVIVDEAYIDFSNHKSLLTEITHFDNLLVMQTFSKAWGLAGLRLGMAFANENLLAWFNKVKPPYNINAATQEIISEALENKQWVFEKINATFLLRNDFIAFLNPLSFVEKIYETAANFVLIKVTDVNDLYDYLAQKGIVTRNRNKDLNCKNCLRISIGTAPEMEALKQAFENYKK